MKGFKQYIAEMPYIEWKGTKSGMFDVEEEISSGKREYFIAFIKSIFSGKKHTDKHGNTVHLKNNKDKREFLDALVNHPVVGKLGMYHSGERFDWEKILGVKL